MGLLALKERLGKPLVTPRGGRPAPALVLVKSEPASWDAVVSRLLVSWESFGPADELALRLAGWTEDRREAFEERAGVLEEGGLSRQEAERRAVVELMEYNGDKDRKGTLGSGGAAA
jgi:hypothetical protein